MNTKKETFQYPELHAIPGEEKSENGADETQYKETQLESNDVVKDSQHTELNNDKPKSQFANNETDDQGEQMSEGELKDESTPTKKTKKAKRIKKAKSPLINKVTRIIRRVFIGGVIVVGVGSGYIWANQNGYVTMVINSLHSGDVTSELDTKQNEMITKLQLALSDLKKEMSELSDNMNSTNKAISRKQDEINGRIVSLKDEYELNKVRTEVIQKQNSARSLLNKDTIETKLAELAKVNTMTRQAQKDTNTNAELINRLQIKIGDINLQFKKSLEEQKKNRNTPKSKNTAVKGNVRNTTYQQEDQTPTSTSYLGLSISQIFNWSTQMIAVLSDSTGTNIQVIEGNKLGNSTITKIDKNHIEIRDDLSGITHKLVKEF